MSEEIKFDHFKDINELLEHIDLWYREDDIEYTRWFGLEDLYNLKIYMTSLQQKVEQQEKERDRLNNIINRIDNFVDRTIEVIKQQPTGDDEWILERLNGIKYLIELKENNK